MALSARSAAAALAISLVLPTAAQKPRTKPVTQAEVDTSVYL
jgi:hypothetical protein